MGSSIFTAGKVSILGLSSSRPPSQVLRAAGLGDPPSMPPAMVSELLLRLMSPAMTVAVAWASKATPPLSI